jgi:hypothetical protein
VRGEPDKDLAAGLPQSTLQEGTGEMTKLAYFKNNQMGPLLTGRQGILVKYYYNGKGDNIYWEAAQNQAKLFLDSTVYYTTLAV